MKMTRRKIQFLACLSLLLCGQARAMDSTDILPAGVNSPAVRYVTVSGIDSKYSADGSVLTLNEINTINFDSSRLAQINPEVTTLVNVLDQFSRQNLGTQLNLGTLRIETEPRVSYIAPIYARGLSDRFTLAMAVPIVTYENKLHMAQSSSNVGAICSQFSSLDQDAAQIKEACTKLDIKIVDAVADEITAKGYRPIHDRKESLLGDAQILGMWKVHDDGDTSSLLRTTFVLPTGKKNDPDDLADLGVFGQTSVEPMMIFNYVPARRVRFATKAGYKVMIPDSQEVRVPGSAGDFLPGPETKENLSRQLGNTITTGAALNLGIGDSFVISGGYEYNHKARDTFKGQRGLNYDLLSLDTQSRAHKLRGGLSYDTIALYQRRKNFPPLKLDYEVTNTIAGLNVDRQMVNELSLSMFF